MKWDRSGNKTERVVTMRGLAAGSPLANRTFAYGFDSVNRLVQSSVSPALPMPARAATPGVAPGASIEPTRTFQYDYANRLVRYDNGYGVATKFAYDALGRRVQKTLDKTAVGGEASATNYFYDGDQIIEETDDVLTPLGGGSIGGQTRATYINGLYVDEPLQMRRKGAAGAPDTVYYFHRDDLYSIVALTDSTGAVAERYDYDDYGAPTFLNPNGTPETLSGSSSVLRNSSSLNNRYLFTGREWDPELNLYFYRSRYYDPRMGRFTQMDSIGVWGDAGNVGNGYIYVGSAPLTNLDPFGDAAKFVKVGFLGWTQEQADQWGLVLQHYKATVFDSRQYERAYELVKSELDTSKNGKYDSCDKDADLGIAGYSWGGWTVLVLIHKIEKEFMDWKEDAEKDAKLSAKLTIRLGFLDPVSTIRSENAVTCLNHYFVPGERTINYYQTYGMRGPFFIPNTWFRGEAIAGAINVDVTGKGGKGGTPDHWDLGYNPQWNTYAKDVAKRTFEK